MDTVAAAMASILVSFGVVGAVGVLFRSLMEAKNQQIEWLREANREQAATIKRLTTTNERAIAVVEEAAPAAPRRRATRPSTAGALGRGGAS